MPDAPDSPLDRIWDEDDYNRLRKVLRSYFVNNGLSPAEDLVSDVILRMWNKLILLFSEGPTERDQDYDLLLRLYEKHASGGKLAGDKQCAADLLLYARGIARNVAHEQRRRRPIEPLPDDLDDLGEPARQGGAKIEKSFHSEVFPDENEELSEQCLHRCLRSLPKEQDLLLKYYHTDKKKDSGYHQKLAAELGMKLNALYAAVRRAREKVRECVVACMERELPGSTSAWCKE